MIANDRQIRRMSVSITLTRTTATSGSVRSDSRQARRGGMPSKTRVALRERCEKEGERGERELMCMCADR
jgi:hypothetical protein